MSDPKNDLERALVAAMNDPNARAVFYDVLLASELLFVTPPADKRAADQLVMVGFQGPNGRFTPMFSSRERLESTLGERLSDFEVLALSGKDAFAILAKGSELVVLNPGSLGKSFPPEEVQAIARGELGAAAHVVPAGRQIMLGQPAEPPTALLDALVVHAKTTPAIEALHHAQLHDPSSGEPPHPVIGVTAAELRAVIPALSALATAHCTLPVDFVGMQGEGIAAYLREIEPFYRR